MNKKWIAGKSILYHLAGWALIFGGWYYFRYQDYPAGTALAVTFLKVADLAVMVYLTNYLLIPKLLYRRNYLFFAFSFIFIVFVFSIIKMLLEVRMMHLQIDLTQQLKSRIYDNVIPHFLLVSTGAAIKLLADYARAQKHLADLAKEKAEAEMNFLKMQVNPHFLFNSLNSVYFLIEKENTLARETLLQFSGLLRYQLYDCSAATVELEKEIQYLRDFVSLQSLRKDPGYAVSLDISGDFTGMKIVPLLLIPFVENAFKHLSHHSAGKNYVEIRLGRFDQGIHFHVENSRDCRQKSNEPAGGIGLANVQRRLELSYPGKHDLSVTKNESNFVIDLKLQLV